MKNRIMIISGRDKRKRYKFLKDPLSLSNIYNVSIVHPEDLGYIKFLTSIFNDIHRVRDEIDFIILIGIDFTSLYVTLINVLFFKKKIIIRLGGNPFKERRTYIASILKQKHYMHFIKHVLNYFFSVITYLLNTNYILVDDSILDSEGFFSSKNKNIGVIPQYIDVKKNYLQSESIEINNELIILTVTNLNYFEKCVGVKSLISLLNSFVVKHSSDIKIKYIIVGGGNYLDELKYFISKQCIDDRLILETVGFADNIDNYYSKADIFCYYSELDYIPNSILEAKAFGLPILTNYIKPFESLIKDGLHGFFIFEEDIEDFNRKLSKLIYNFDLRKYMCKKNIEDIENRFSKQAIKNRLEAYFETLT